MLKNCTLKAIALSLCLAITATVASPVMAAQGTKVAADTQKPVTITVSNYPKATETAQRAQWAKWIEAMKAKYPYITVKPDEYQYNVNTFFPKAASGQTATVYTSWFTEINKIISAHYSADITDAMKQYGYLDSMDKNMLALFTRDGRVYGMPTDAYSMGLGYNVGLWQKAGLTNAQGVPNFPKTYEELAKDCQIIKEKTGQAGFFFPGKSNQGGWQFMNIAWAFGANFETQDADGKWKATFNSPEAVAALQFLKDMKWKYKALQDNVFVNGDDMFRMMGTNQVATAFDTLGWMQIPIRQYKMDRNNIAMSALPAGPKGKAVLMGGNEYFISNKATPEQIDAAFKWFGVVGFSPKFSAEDTANYETNAKTSYSSGWVTGLHDMRVWTPKDRIRMEDSINMKYLNVDMNKFKDYVNNATANIRPEEPVSCQELYKILDGVIQNVLTNQNADCKVLLDKAVSQFQKSYLDKVK